jgi:hypothetical protein
MMGEVQTRNTQFRKDNHYVPRLYLKRWAIGGQISTYRILVPHERSSVWKCYSVDAIGKHEHLYTKIALSRESDEFERWLCDDFETPAEPAIERVITDRRLSTQDWRALIRFVAAQDVRTPARLIEMLKRGSGYGKTIEQSLADSVQKLETARREGKRLEATASTPRFPFPVRTRIQPSPVPAGGGTLEATALVGRAMWLFQLEHLLTHTLEVLTDHHWTVLRTPKGKMWVTSDDPVIRINLTGPGRYSFCGGWGNPGGRILLPLGPEHLLYTQIGSRSAPKGSRVPEDEFALIQRIIIEHAHRLVFARAEDREVVAIRPRLVDAKIHRNELDQWRHWHEEQSAAERELFE